MSSQRLVQWLADARTTSASCAVIGPAGIGKSHLIDELVAGADGWRVLMTRPAEAEQRLVGSALLDLCEDVSDEELARLTPTLRRALAASLLRDEPASETSPRAVAAAFTALIRELAATSNILLVVDDIQWLDAETAQVLGFAARRLPAAGVAVLAGLRTGPQLDEPQVVGELRAALPHTVVTVAPLPVDTLEAVIRARLGQTIAPSVVHRAVEFAGGNPLFGIEVARSLLTGSAAHTPGHLPVPSTLAQVVTQHVLGLPEPTRRLLAAASAIRKPSVAELRTLGVSDSLSDAERAGMINVNGSEITFTHPLYAAAAYDGLTGMERVNLHARIAEVVIGEEERARHMALGAEQPDEAVAVALDHARDRALARGALNAAIDACQLALRATPEGSAAKSERLIESARLLYRSGEGTLAREQLMAAVAEAPDPHMKARALHELARIMSETESEAEAARLYREALALSGDDLQLTADIHVGLARTTASDWAVALEHAQIAATLLDQIPNVDPRKLAAAHGAYLGSALYAGEGADFERCRRAIELEAGTVDLPVSDRAISILPFLYLWTDDFPNARKYLDVAYQLSIEEGDEPSRAYTLSNMARVEIKAGNWGAAEGYIRECRELFQRSGIRYFATVADQHKHWLDIYRGEFDAALVAAESDIEVGMATDNALVEVRGRAIRGYCWLMQGDAAAAAAELDIYRELFAKSNANEPALRMVAGEHIEALVSAGRLDDAQRAIDELVADATRLGRTAVLAAAARGEALLHAARGEGDSAIEAATRSLALYDQVERRFDRARALMTRGQIHRRLRHKSMAMKDLTAAFDEFTALGAQGFARTASEERDRIGIRRSETSTSLTETERKVADLTAQGLTASEVGARLFLSPKTVSANLTVIYRKLGVRNRAELIAQYLS